MFWTNLTLIKFVSILCVCSCCFMLCVYFCRCIIVPLAVKGQSVSKRTRNSSTVSNSKRFKIPLDSQTFSSIFQEAPTMVERIVQFDTLGSTFIPSTFADKDWANLFGNFEDPIDELVKELYSNARFTGVELKCQVRGKEFIITPNYLAKILRII